VGVNSLSLRKKARGRGKSAFNFNSIKDIPSLNFREAAR
jgi:hypothetical protein